LTLSYYFNSSAVQQGSGTGTLVAVPSSLTYGNSFTAPTTVIPGSPSPGYGFYDAYIFQITGATANSISTTIDLGTMLQITDLQERLYNYSGNTAPTLGAPVGGAIDAWTSPIGTYGTVAVLPTTVLSAGTYVLEIRGNVTGSSGGSYSGSLNVAPIPIPAALPMLLTGLGLLGGVMRRRRHKA